jgi:glycosyltransferase involved in cell wall biosynthesis
MRVSTIVLMLNEERNLPRWLAALDWCDDIIVVDSGSTDATVEIARMVHPTPKLFDCVCDYIARRRMRVACVREVMEYIVP